MKRRTDHRWSAASGALLIGVAMILAACSGAASTAKPGG